MTFAISIVVLIEAIALIYFGLAILEIREKTNNMYPELIKIINDQQDVLNGTLDSLRRWSDLSADIIDHIERVEDMEGDIKDIFEWIHSIDDNIANMRSDIQETDTKLGDLMAIYDRDVRKFSNDFQSLQKDITEIETGIDMNAYWKIRSTIDPGECNWDDWNKLITDNMQLAAKVTEKQFQDYRTRVAEAVKAVKLEGDDNA